MQPIRPINLNLFTIRFPLPAIISILHRISGVILFICVPLVLTALEMTLYEEGFTTLQEWFNKPLVRLGVWLFLAPLCFHLVAGIRHLLMDIHVGTSLANGRLSAALTLVISIGLVIITGIWLW